MSPTDRQLVPSTRRERTGRRHEPTGRLGLSRQRPQTRALGLKSVAAIAVVSIVAISISLPLALGSQASAGDGPASATLAAMLAETPTSSPTAQPTITPTPGRSAVDLPNSVFGAYTVRTGDTLTRIANSFDLSVTTLYWANSGKISNPNLIRIGQSLLIPPVDGVVATVVPGDTAQSISDKYGIDPQDIIDANELPTTSLQVGQTLILPGVPPKPLPEPLTVMKPVDWLNKLAWPVPDRHTITLLFGCTTWPAEPRFGKCRHWHNGLDIGAKWGTTVVAAYSGTVIYAGRRRAGTDGAAGGIVVWISHGGTLYTTYNHLSGVTVKTGQKVETGQQIGRVGETGAASGAHLHFEVWTDFPWTGGTMADAVDPLKYTKYKP